jgi:hypothetical protein
MASRKKAGEKTKGKPESVYATTRLVRRWGSASRSALDPL